MDVTDLILCFQKLGIGEVGGPHQYLNRDLEVRLLVTCIICSLTKFIFCNHNISQSIFLQGLKGQQILELIECGGRLDRPEKCQQGVYEIMLRCWTYE